MDRMLKALKRLGFSETEAKRQLEELGNLITAKITLEIVGELPKDVSQKELTALFEAKMKDQENRQKAKEIAEEVSQGYLESITGKLNEDEKKEFFNSIK